MNSRCIFNTDVNVNFILKLTSEIHFSNTDILTDLFSFNLTESDEELKKTHIMSASEILSLFYTWHDILTVINLSSLSKYMSVIQHKNISMTQSSQSHSLFKQHKSLLHSLLNSKSKMNLHTKASTASVDSLSQQTESTFIISDFTSQKRAVLISVVTENVFNTDSD